MGAAGPQSLEAAIAERLVRMLGREVPLGPGCVRFIDSTFSTPSASAIARLLADESDPERDGLLALLLAPDEEHRVEIEPLLDSAEGDVDAGGIAARLTHDIDRVRFRLPEGRGAFAVALTAELARGFVAGLALGRRIPQALRAALQSIADERERLLACVTVRHAGVELTPARTAILCRVVAQPGAGDPGFLGCLGFTLEVLGAVETDSELWALLEGRKRRLAEALSGRRRQDELLAQTGFEIAQSRGRRLGFVDRDAAERELGFIDRVCLCVFGRIPHAGLDRIETAFELGDPHPD
ncbi:MAG: hypothetical protein MUE48_05810 [Desulfobacterales bacterium]|jgi:hypothetical protein|nr:hypothetical protein [Desulfobacterales bacterium]